MDWRAELIKFTLFRLKRKSGFALILLVLIAVVFIVNPPIRSFSGIISSLLMIIASIFFYMGATEYLSSMSLSRRLVLCFFSLLLLWGITGFVGAFDEPEVSSGSQESAARILELGKKIDHIAEVGSGQVQEFVDSTFTGQTGQLLETIGQVSGATAEILIDAVLTSTSIDTSVLDVDSVESTGSINQIVTMIPLVRFVILAFALLLLAAVRSFVYIDRSSKTVWIFRTTVAIAYAITVFRIIGFSMVISSDADLFRGIQLDLAGIFLLIFSVILGFNQRWIQYLSRKTRVILILASLVSVIMLRGVYYHLTGNVFAGTGGLEENLVFIIGVYVLFSFFTMILQLPTARILEKRNKELGTLQELSYALHSSFEPEQLGVAAVKLGIQLTGADYCWLYLTDESKSYSFGKKDEFGNLLTKLTGLWYQEINERINSAGRGFMLNNYRRSSLRKLETKEKRKSSIASMLVAPVEVRGERLGVIFVVSSKQFFFLEYTRALFDSFSRQIAQAVQSAQLFGEKLQRQALEKELQLARDIQRSLLPNKIIQPTGWEIAASSIPSRVMGGDYYDVLELSDNRIAVAIADVSGKGAAAAMLMAALQASLVTLLKENLSVNKTTERLNQALCDRMPEATFITFFLAFINVKTGEIQYCSAGHDPPLLCDISDDSPIQKLSEGGLILGVIPDAEYNCGRAIIKEGGKLLLYTDGITETFSPSEEPFGLERLEKFLLKYSKASGEENIAEINSIVELFRESGDQTDDVTSLIVTRLQNLV